MLACSPICCSFAQSCPTLFNPWTAAHQASLSFTVSQTLLKLMSIESVMQAWKVVKGAGTRRESFLSWEEREAPCCPGCVWVTCGWHHCWPVCICRAVERVHWRQSLFFCECMLSHFSPIQLFLAPWTAAISQSLLKLMSIESVMASNRLIICRPLLLPPSTFPSSRVFSNELAPRIRWPKYWSFSLSPSNEYSELISFRIDWFDLLAVQGTFYCKPVVNNNFTITRTFYC